MDDEIPEDINVHKQIWGKDADQVIYGEGEKRMMTNSDVLDVIHV